MGTQQPPPPKKRKARNKRQVPYERGHVPCSAEEAPHARCVCVCVCVILCVSLHVRVYARLWCCVCVVCE